MKYLSLFSGIGGLESGLDKIGGQCIGFSEIKQSSMDIYQSHFPDRINIGDLTKVNYEDLEDFDLLMGGFPCQSFSLAGMRKGFNDPRGIMILYIYNLLIVKKPKYFVLENVKGILSHDNGKTYIKIHKLLKSAGYKLRIVLLNSLDYGSAQSRERVFFLGSLEEFPYKKPVVIDRDKVFKDIKEEGGDYRLYEFEDLRRFNLELIGDHDRVGTLTTQQGCGNKRVAVGDSFRELSVLECERLQGFDEGWTTVEGVKVKDRYWALGNAVNCNVSDYLFRDYLKGVWF